jgi:uncharacterized repeat protein (TIGR01451 family)
MIRRPTLALFLVLVLSLWAPAVSGPRSALGQSTDPAPVPYPVSAAPETSESGGPPPVAAEPEIPPQNPVPAETEIPLQIPTPAAEAGPSFDGAVQHVQGPGPGGPPAPGGPAIAQPGAREKPGSAPASVPPSAPAGEAFFLPADRLKTGPNAVGVTVEVRAPEVANLNLPSVIWILVKNSGPTEATNIGVRYPISEKLKFVQSDPPPALPEKSEQYDTSPFFYWQINVLPAGGEKVIKVTVQPKEKGDFDHAVTVTMQAGAKARTVVREPRLKVEVRPSKKEILNGNPVTYDISVSNYGDYVARDVVIKAKLGSGLYHKRGTDLVLPIADLQGHESGELKPGDTITARLEVDAKAMGKQPCTITVTSPDVTTEVSASAEIEVVEPQLSLTVSGPSERYTDTVARYRITLRNTGTATAKKVQVAAQVPSGGKPIGVEPRALWKPEVLAFFWLVPEMPPGDTQDFEVEVKMGSIGSFQLQVAAKADEPPVRQVKQYARTDIRGVSRVRVSLSEPRGVLDEGEETEYEVSLTNDGSQEATNVLVTGTVSDNLQVVSVSGPDGQPQPVAKGTDSHKVPLPPIDRIPIGGKVVLSFRVRAIRAGDATCQVQVLHNDIQTALMSNSILTRVTASPNAPNRK